MLPAVLLSLAHDPLEVEHVRHHGLRCGTDEYPTIDKHKHGRALAKTDCSESVTNPRSIYSPSQGSIYRIKTCVHIIMTSDGQTGAISQACVNGGCANCWGPQTLRPADQRVVSRARQVLFAVQ